MKRLFYDTLLKWKDSKNKKPMMVIGARQTGKTYIINEFCNNEYKNNVYLNFDNDNRIVDIFKENKNPENIINKIKIMLNIEFDEEETIIFLDEIQICEEAINSLKYFCESNKNYNIICAGSLLGVKLNRYNSSFPVGKVKIEKLYPMNFEEFLVALGEEKLLLEIKECYISMKKMPEILHSKALEFYKDYLIVGGMPASIMEFINNDKDILKFEGEEKKDILTSYIADMAKYTTSVEALKVRNIYEKLPEQLAKDTAKFKYQIIDKYARSREYETALDWLIQSEITLKCNNVTSSKIPLEAYKSDSSFKIYFNDVGLFMTCAKIPKEAILQNIDMIYKGNITENYIAQTLVSKKKDLYYLKMDNNLEIDFFLQEGIDIIPIEVKSSDRVKSTSLNNYIKKYSPKYSIRISTRNFGFENNIKSVPLYAAHLI